MSNHFFINDCHPRTGIIDNLTVIELEIGFTQETFQKKQIIADQRMAERLMQQESNENTQEIFRRIRQQHFDESNQRRRHLLGAFFNRGGEEEHNFEQNDIMVLNSSRDLEDIFGQNYNRKTTPNSIVQSLPLRQIS